MATERLQIVVDERGARVVQGNLENIGRGARRAEGGVTLLRRALGAFAGAAAIRGIVRTADAFTTLQNRLRLVTDGTSQLNAVQDELLAISNRTRSGIESNAEVFNRLAQSTRELGLTQQDVLNLTESLNQAVQISGATATEAQAGLIQLSQGLASGALRGDELRSVLEQLPAVADVIATELGVTRGELRELGAQGEITAEVVTSAFANAREELSERFGRTVPTISQGFTVLRNNVVNFVGRLSDAIGLSGGFAQILLDIGEAVGDVTDEFEDGALAIREFVEVGVAAIANFAETITPRLAQARAEVVKFFAALLRDEATFQAAFQDQRDLQANIDETISRLTDEFDAIRANAEARRAALESDRATLDLEVAGGGQGVEQVEELDQATQNLIESQQELFQSLLLEERALQEAIDTGGDYSLILDRLQTDAIAAATGLEGLAFDINETRQAIADLRQEQANNEFITELEQQNEALQIAVDTGRDLSEVLDELAIRRQFINDQEGLQEALDLQEANERLEAQLQQSENSLSVFLNRARENAQDILGGALADVFDDGLDELPAKFAQVLLDLSAQFLASEIFRALGTLGAGGGGGIAAAVGGFFAGSFNTGGQFRVPGSGGPDSVPVSMNLTPRETVTITPAGQAPPGGAGQGSAPPVVNVSPAPVVVVDSEEKARSALNSQAGEDAVLGIIERNGAQIRNLLA